MAKKNAWIHYPVQAGTGNRCTLLFDERTLTYDLGGYIEILRTGADEEGAGPPRLSVPVVRLVGRLIDGAACGAPRTIWLYPRTTTAPAAEVELDGIVTVNTRMSFVVESRSGDVPVLTEPLVHGFAAVPFAVADLHVNLTLGATDPGLVIRGTGLGDSPIAQRPVALDIQLCCGPSLLAPKCLELCLHVKIAVDDGVPLVEPKDIESVVQEANKLLGCDPPGQCCIKLRIGGIVAVYKPKISLDIDGKKKADVFGVTKIERVDPKTGCYNLYVVRTINNTAGGVTAWGSDTIDGSLINQDSAQAPTGGGRILAHELGHALGLARGGGDELDPAGVDHHSSDDENLMSGVGGTPGDGLNSLQCTKMRSSPHLKPTDAPCTGEPHGRIGPI